MVMTQLLQLSIAEGQFLKGFRAGGSCRTVWCFGGKTWRVETVNPSWPLLKRHLAEQSRASLEGDGDSREQRLCIPGLGWDSRAQRLCTQAWDGTAESRSPASQVYLLHYMSLLRRSHDVVKTKSTLHLWGLNSQNQHSKFILEMH